MTDNLKELPPPEKKVAAKVLYDMGWSSRQIESWIGIDNVTVIRASEQPTPEALKQFETEFTIAIQSEKMKGIAIGVKRLLELIPKERRVDQVVKGLEYFEGRNNPNIAIQVNNVTSEKQQKYNI